MTAKIIPPMPIKERIAILSVVGLEYYDFFVMALLAPYLATVFFGSSTHTWVSILGVYAAGAWCRPLGAIFWGHFSDRLGRKKPLVGAAILMFLASLVIGLIPIDAVGRNAAILILLIMRMVQGFALGGDSSIVNTLIAEKSPDNRRGFYLGFAYGTNCGTSAFASLLIFFLSTHFSHQQMIHFGWRIPFLVGAGMLLVFVILRTRVRESTLFEAEPIRHTFPAIASLRFYYRQLILSVAIGLFGNAIIGLLIYLPTYLHKFYHWPASKIGLFYALSSFYLAAIHPFIGHFSDKMKRKKLLITSCIIFLIALWPIFSILNTHTFLHLLLFMIILKTLFCFVINCAQTIYTELFPTHVRTTGVAIASNVTGALGATMPVALSALVIALGIVKGPIIALVIVCCITMFATLIFTDQTGKSLSTIKREIERH